MNMEKDLTRYHVPNLDKALSLVELMADFPRGLSKAEIVDKLGLTTNIVYRIAATLQARGYIYRDQNSKAFRLSDKMNSVGCKALDEHSLVHVAWPIMQDLRDATKETVLLGIRRDTRGVILEGAEGLHPVRFTIPAGENFVLHSGAPGKLLLAFEPEQVREALMVRIDFTRYNERTITTNAALRKEMQMIRECGHALDRGEILEGVQCAAAPIFNGQDELDGTIWVTAPTLRMPDAELAQLADVVVEHANRISAELGCFLGK
jgi:DNA-binding IclR family transcriptional regulator